MAYTKPKFPRILVNVKRHEVLSKEAAKLKISIAQLVEEKFKKAK